MQTIQASEVDFSSILDEAEQGETVVITRDGRAIARVSPETTFDRERYEQAKASILEYGSEPNLFRWKRFFPHGMKDVDRKS